MTKSTATDTNPALAQLTAELERMREELADLRVVVLPVVLEKAGPSTMETPESLSTNPEIFGRDPASDFERALWERRLRILQGHSAELRSHREAHRQRVAEEQEQRSRAALMPKGDARALEALEAFGLLKDSRTLEDLHQLTEGAPRGALLLIEHKPRRGSGDALKHMVAVADGNLTTTPPIARELYRGQSGKLVAFFGAPEAAELFEPLGEEARLVLQAIRTCAQGRMVVIVERADQAPEHVGSLDLWKSA